MLFARWWLAVEPLFVDFFVLDLVDDLVGADFDFFEDVIFVGLGLYFDGFVDHVTKLSIALVELPVAFE